ncbi:S26 family signal peptidase [Streptomyces rugosispiralis]|uniref:S26 family signal peptidase n=1 Tax=Streptomyces rugosispiralis TaxID=2967341 RepID=A0ABT1UQY8_9ACTN|nr:S26 family signal peptidase [Streptomyces rugosispiralis]MCQ8187049.1 S26 family signal peptidase [Streptomyces rugosispiralis]
MALGLGMALGAALITGTVLRRTLVVVTVRGGSMEPTYRDGERVLVRRGGRCAVGQVVVVRQEDGGRPSPAPSQAVAAVGNAQDWMIKRVAAVAGDRPPPGALPAPYATDGPVPPGALVLLGDNTHNSYDSREAGYFPAAHVLGTVLRPRPRPTYDETRQPRGCRAAHTRSC